MTSKLIFLLLTAFALQSQAQISLGDPEMSGLGCPQGTARATLSPDKTVLSLIFDQFIAEAGKTLGTDFAMKNCVVRVPVTIPAGKRVAITKAHYRGAVSLPGKPAWADLIFQYGWLYNYNQPNLKFESFFDSKMWLDQVDENYFYEVNVVKKGPQGQVLGPLWSTCSPQKVWFEFGAKLRLHMAGSNGDALGTVDSLDTGAEQGMDFLLLSENCR